MIPTPECCIFNAVSGDTHINAVSGHFGHMTIWPYGQNMAIWPIDIWPKWPKIALIWVSPETAIKMQHSGEGIMLIGHFF